MADTCCASTSSTTALNNPRWRRVLWVALALNAAMFAVEIGVGVSADSRSLQADALDFLGDSANYAISLGVAGLALRWRSGAALLKGATILLFGLAVFAWAIWGLLNGAAPQPTEMGVIGALALAVNLTVVLLLFRYRTGDANMRSVWICSRNDAIGNLLVLAAAGGVWLTGSALPDLAVALIMAALGIAGGWQIVRHARSELRPAADLPVARHAPTR